MFNYIINKYVYFKIFDYLYDCGKDYINNLKKKLKRKKYFIVKEEDPQFNFIKYNKNKNKFKKIKFIKN